MFFNKILPVLAVVLFTSSLIAEEHDHAHEEHDHAHEEHDHGKHNNHADEGEAREIGDIVLASVTYGIGVHGSIKAGQEAIVTIGVEEGTAPSELRAWVGIKNGRGSVKALLKANKNGGFHGHLEVPAELPDGSALWIEVVTDSARERGSIALSNPGEEGLKTREGHDHNHEGHDHKDHAHEGHDHKDHEHEGHDHKDHEHDD